MISIHFCNIIRCYTTISRVFQVGRILPRNNEKSKQHNDRRQTDIQHNGSPRHVHSDLFGRKSGLICGAL